MRVKALDSFFTKDFAMTKGGEYDLPPSHAKELVDANLVVILTPTQTRKTAINAPKSRRTAEL